MAYTRFCKASFGPAYTGAAAGYTLRNADGSTSAARTATGVVESPAGSGVFGATVSFPDGFVGSIDWDTATSPNRWASASVNPSDSEYQDLKLSTRASQSSLDTLDDYVDTEVAAIKAKTDNLPASPAATGAAMTLTVAYDAAKTAAAQASVDAVAGYIDTEVSAIKAKTDLIPASPAAVGSAVTLDLTQAIPTTNTAQTVGDALNAARGQGFGKWVKDGNLLRIYAPDGTTVIRTFTLDDADAPTSRT